MIYQNKVISINDIKCEKEKEKRSMFLTQSQVRNLTITDVKFTNVGSCVRNKSLIRTDQVSSIEEKIYLSVSLQRVDEIQWICLGLFCCFVRKKITLMKVNKFKEYGELKKTPIYFRSRNFNHGSIAGLLKCFIVSRWFPASIWKNRKQKMAFVTWPSISWLDK